jgi:hypothetical protein
VMEVEVDVGVEINRCEQCQAFTQHQHSKSM